MKYELTSNEAAKMLKKLNEELTAIRDMENLTKEFNASVGEDPDSVRPAYDYRGTQERIEDFEKKIISLKHQISAFNLKTEVPGTGMTVDQVLVLIPMLTKKKAKFAEMAKKLPKTRVEEKFGRSSNVIDYVYINYDAADALRDYNAVSDRLSEVQTALDIVNNTVRFTVDI